MGALPEHLLQLYDQESKQSPLGKRASQTQIINKLFKRVNGSWQLDVSDAQFRDYKAIYEERYSGRKRSNAEELDQQLFWENKWSKYVSNWFSISTHGIRNHGSRTRKSH